MNGVDNVGGGAEFGDCKAEYKNDCFAYVSGKCRILTECDFGNRKCPFFKERRNQNGREERNNGGN